MSEWTVQNEHDSDIYGEGYNDGYHDGYDDACKDNDLFHIDKVAEMFLNFLGDGPCNYNDIDEKTCDDKWCDENCTNASPLSCWEQAIKMRWI